MDVMGVLGVSCKNRILDFSRNPFFSLLFLVSMFFSLFISCRCCIRHERVVDVHVCIYVVYSDFSPSTSCPCHAVSVSALWNWFRPSLGMWRGLAIDPVFLLLLSLLLSLSSFSVSFLFSYHYSFFFSVSPD